MLKKKLQNYDHASNFENDNIAYFMINKQNYFD